MEAFFTGGHGASPRPMTLVSSFFSDGYPDSDCLSFSQLLAGVMASPLAFGASRPSFFANNSFSKEAGWGSEDGSGSRSQTQKSLGFNQSGPMTLAIARSPLLTVPPGLSPSGLLNSPGFLSAHSPLFTVPPGSSPSGLHNSPGFFSPQSPFVMSHQQALAQVTAQAILAQFHMQMQADYQPSAVTAPKEPLVQKPSSTLNEASEQQVEPSVSGPVNAQLETSEMSHADKKHQPSFLAVEFWASENPADDGYNWRMYGLKQVNESDYPRRYYRCTHLNCPVKKQDQRDPDGYIIAIIYRGRHNHEKPKPNRCIKDNCDLNETASIKSICGSSSRGLVGNSNKFGESLLDCSSPESVQICHHGAPRQQAGSSESEEVGDVDIREEEGDDIEPNPKRRWSLNAADGGGNTIGNEVENHGHKKLKTRSATKEKICESNVNPHNNSKCLWPLFTESSEEEDSTRRSDSNSHDFSGPSCYQTSEYAFVYLEK